MLFGKKLSFDQNDFDSVIVACIAGNSLAQRHLYKQYFGYSKSICLRYTSNMEQAEEVLNEGFLKIFNNLDKYDSAHPFKAWLRTIMVNTAISYYRKHRKHSDDIIPLDEFHSPSVDDDVIGCITAEEILRLVQSIKPVHKNVFLLYAVEGYNHREIAEMLDINEATVRSHYVRARARLQTLIQQNYPHLVPRDWTAKTYKENENR